ncbi:MAG: phosphoribosylaminoimidazolesuccinocarboxamide synthase [Actinomycetia bacterium]|nr:phosphoribosylaminoimidazolesuccinocarboxamide synthase [Actinomycetes bacterium]
MLLTDAIPPDRQGKVRDIYDLGEQLLMVATDRLSAFDVVLPDLIPHKGAVLTQMSIYWFEMFDAVIGSHFISADVSEYPARFRPYASELKGRSMLVHKVEMFPVECIVRGYMAGSAWQEYQRTGTVGGVEVPTGLVEASRLEDPIYTPTTKGAPGEPDLPLSIDQTVEMLGRTPAMTLCVDSLEIYRMVRDMAAHRGIIIADTKFEFGMLNGEFVVADELLTPDSSRFWPSGEYQEGREQPSYDKQVVRDWLRDNWDRQGLPPHLPAEVIEATSQRYIQAFELLTGQEFSTDI